MIPLRVPVLLAFVTLLAPPRAGAQEPWNPARPDSDAPFGVTADRLVEKGHLVVGYRFTRATLRGYRVEDHPVETDSVLLSYPEAADRRTRETHEFSVRVAPSRRLTLSATVPLMSLETEHKTAGGQPFATSASGLGDVSADVLFEALGWSRQQLLLLFRASLPTGAIDVTDATPAGGAATLLPYPMQLGTGTVDLRPGVAYVGQNNSASWGVQLQMMFRLGDNDRGYHWGNGGMLTAWLAGRWADWISSSMRVEFRRSQTIQGADAGMDAAVTPEADPLLQGGTQADGMLGTNIRIPGGFLGGTRIGVEFTLPMYVSLHGPQLRDRGVVTVGARYGFRLFGN